MIPSAAQQEARTILQHLIPALHATGHWIRMAQPGVSRETKSTRQEIAPTSIHNALTEVDLLAQQSLESSLRPFRDRLPAIGEEDTPYSLLHPPKEGNSHALFCSIDPIDGTFAYCAGAEDYCSMLACFDHRQFHWGAVHFPSLRESMIGSPEEGARVRKIVPHTTDLLDAHLEGGFEEQPYPKSSASEEKCIAVHYRFLLDPFRDRAARLMEQGFHFCTLAGEPSVDWAKPKLVGSNGALLAEVLGGRASA
ncbi:MAG: inositol monophosphatase family protein, partial [Verrucomicrobiota bacterium]